jgi:type I restriction enzyme, S subunit
MRVRPYSCCKPSGVDWLGDVPAHWQVLRGRYCMRVNPRSDRLRALPPDAEVSFVPMEAVRELGGLDLEATLSIPDAGTYTEFEDGDVIVAKITPCFENGKGAIATALLNGAAFGTTELHVLRVLPNLENRFLFYLTTSDAYRKIGEAEMYGAAGQKRVPPEFNKDFSIPLPPLNEQCSIADFLDTVVAKIDRLVQGKRALIEKLHEKQAALISQTVTHGLPPAAARAAGLNPHPKLKPSKVEWLRDVPEHWSIQPLKRAVTFQRGHDLPVDDRMDGNFPVVSSSGILGSHIEARAKGPGIVTGRYGTIGQFHLTWSDYWPLNTALYSIDIHGNDVRFLRYMLMHLAPLFLLEAVKSAVPGVDRNDIHPVSTAIPNVREQQVIADYLDIEAAKIDRVIAKVEEAIDRLQEYRTAFITAAVTGKIDLREATPTSEPALLVAAG